MVPSAAVSRHPYGFLVVRLPAKISEADVRFNVWLKENRPGQEPNWPIHSHEVSMSSYVVRGELENLVWPEPRFGFGEPLYLASYTKSTSVLTKMRLANLGRPQGLRNGSRRNAIRGGEGTVSRNQHSGRCRMRDALHVSCGRERHWHGAWQRRSSAANRVSALCGNARNRAGDKGIAVIRVVLTLPDRAPQGHPRRADTGIRQPPAMAS